MKRRLFIAINPDPHTRRAVGKIEKDIEDAFGWERGEGIRFMPEENWHITISFLGTQDDASLAAIVYAMRGTADRSAMPEISFAEVSYAPRKDNPRMIWLKTSQMTDRALGEIKKSLENFLSEAGIRFERESRAFSGHITLARFPNGMSPGDLPRVERPFAINGIGASLDLMESEPERNGSRYTLLQECPFRKTEH
jgi:2'-5' RNA ligase